MAGFVDPAFKHLKLTEPNFLVWRISKRPEENYEAKIVKRELYGNFFDEDSYIIFSSSPVKKPLGICNKRNTSKMEIHIHFWLGSKLSEDNRRRTIIKAIEVDDVLEGAAVVHREIQGHESNRFLSYFRKGFVVMGGEITSVLMQSYVDSRPKLFQLSERASTLLLTEFPSISWTLISSQSVVALEANNKIFLWLGREASTEDKFLALKFERYAGHYGSKKKLIWVADGEEEKLSREDLHDFEDYLNLRYKMVSVPPFDDFVLVQSKSRKNTELYKVMAEENCNTVIYVKDGPLLQSDLSSMEICLIHHYTNCVWIWVSRKVEEDERSRAINIGIAYLEKKPKINHKNMSKMCVTRVVEGWEPVEFKHLFRNWIDNSLADDTGYFRKAIARPMNMALTADNLHESPCLAMETQLFDDGSGKMKVLRVNGKNLEPLQPEQVGIFHASFSYLVHYSYTVRGKTETILYYWLGRNAAVEEKENNIWVSLKDIPDLNDATIRIRIEQNNENPHFHAIFQGKIIVLTRSMFASSKKWSLNDYPIILLKIKGGDVLNTISTEVEPRASSLNSFNVFLLRTPKLSFIWCGKSSKGDEREIAKTIARKWSTRWTVILEGCESEEFWKILGGYRCQSSECQKTELEVNVPPRAFKCSWFHGELMASEIINFTQCDFGLRDVIVFDAWKTIFVWTGRYVPVSEIFESEYLVKAYLNSDPCDRNLAIPVIHIRQDHEPALFRGYFPSWDKTSTVQTFHENGFIKNLLDGQEKVDLVEEEKIASADENVPLEPMETDAQKTTYPPEILQRKSPEELPNGINPNKKEEYLSNDDFFRIFGMARESFDKLPQWKRNHLKKSNCLF